MTPDRADSTWAVIYKVDETRLAKVQRTDGPHEFTEVWSVRVPRFIGRLAARVFYAG